MSNRLILHIGTPKTGTNAIQRFLFDNQELLKEKGFIYPRMPREKYYAINGSEFKNYTNNGIVDVENPGWKEFWKKIRIELQERHVIVSWEDIFNYNINDFFSKVTKEYANIQVIVYLRRQDRYFESFWNQIIKMEYCYSKSFYKFVFSPDTARIYHFNVDYKKRLDEISQIIGNENLIIRPYEKKQFLGARKDVISDFLHALNIEPDWNRCIISKYHNPALLGNYIEIKRKMNKYLTPFSATEIESVLLHYLYFRKNLSTIKHADGMFTPKQRQAFLKQFEEENAEIARQYLGREDGILFYDDKSVPMHKLDDSTLCDDIGKMFEFLFENWKICMSVRPIDSKIKTTSSDDIECTLNKITTELNKLQTQELPKEAFEEKCFDVVERYTPFLVELYKQKSECYQNISKYLQEKCSGKVLYCLGTGGYCQYFLRGTALQPHALLDNNSVKRDKELFGIKILHPSQIQDWSNCFVIITVKKPEIIAAMEQQLQGYGLKKDEDYLVGPEYFMDPY